MAWKDQVVAFVNDIKGAVDQVINFLNKIVMILISIFKTIVLNIKILAENKDNLKIIIPALLILYVALEMIKSLEKRTDI